MANLKQGLTLKMPVRFKNLDMTNVSQIEFTFRQTKTEGAPVKAALYKSNGSGDCTADGNVVYVPWTPEETYLFKANGALYMDTRISISGTHDQPITPIVYIVMNPTLFERE